MGNSCYILGIRIKAINNMGAIMMKMTYMVPYPNALPWQEREKKAQMENPLRNHAQWIPVPLGIMLFSFISFTIILPKFQLMSKLPKPM